MRRWFLLAAYLLAVVLAALYWSTDLLFHDSNRVENELAQNGLSSFVRAALTNEIDYRANYRSDDPSENFALVARELERGGGIFTRLSQGRLDRSFAARPEGLGRMNVVLVSSESFGAEFSRLYGSDRDFTPNSTGRAAGYLVLERLRVGNPDSSRPRGIFGILSTDPHGLDPAPTRV